MVFIYYAVYADLCDTKHTEQNEETRKTDLREPNFTTGRIFRHSIHKGDFTTDKEYKKHVLTVHTCELQN